MAALIIAPQQRDRKSCIHQRASLPDLILSVDPVDGMFFQAPKTDTAKRRIGLWVHRYNADQSFILPARSKAYEPAATGVEEEEPKLI